MDPSISHWSQEFKDIKHSFLLLLFILATFFICQGSPVLASLLKSCFLPWIPGEEWGQSLHFGSFSCRCKVANKKRIIL